MNSQGIDVGVADGIIGKKTKLGLSELQANNNLYESGRLDFETRRLIYKLDGFDPYEMFSDKDIQWIKFNVESSISIDLLEKMGTPSLIQTTENIFINHLNYEQNKLAILEIKKLVMINDLQLLTISDEYTSRMENAINSIVLKTYWDTNYDFNLGTMYSFLGYGCTQDCSGHIAGYEWAAVNDVNHSAQCSNQSRSFQRGCNLFANGN